MSVIATALRELMAAGVTGEALISAVERIEAAHSLARAPSRTARQDRNARYYEKRKVRLEASETVLIQTPKTVSDADGQPQKDGPQTPKKNYPLSESTASADAKPSKRKKPKGELCPEDFEPSETHLAKCRAKGVPEAVADATCRKMRDWSHANADRDIAWKADWSRALHGMLDDEIEKRLRLQARASPAASSPQQRALDRARQAHLELTEDRHDQDPSDAGGLGYLGASRPPNGHADPGVHQSPGGRLRLAPPLFGGPPRPH